ncbi:copper resistance protein NlpE N-terminal domain-containing protein [Bacteroidales bacterium OttesenSCG-928-K03]|nr:copper resistance protein NlpE N-terminal domain-containing protein [Bacteroidales bacterium OttesenSCG-928-L14]MDL2242534.1 copper resistance protein NlpE N-terminal domain-containing protein [Bacteroidales bacterium OttesenSCG-928-K03]
MKSIKKILLILTVAMSLVACKNSNESAKKTVDWAGVYTNILPCADCEGIVTTIELMNDQTYKMFVNYLGENDDVSYSYSGTFNWGKNENQIILKIDNNSHSAPNQYIVKENELIQLDMNDKKITDSNFDYSLEKVSNLIDKKWMLTEMNGKKIEIKNDFLKQPQITINSEYKVNGVGICNNFFGKTYIRSGNKITFPNIASTMMACLQMMDVEQEFFASLDKVEKYSITNNNTLNLYSDNDKLLLTFILNE